MADAELLGLPPEAIVALEERATDRSACEVWRENWPALKAWLAIATQWRAVGRGEGVYFQGLDYTGVRVGLEEAGIERDPDLWADIRVMEAAARNRLNGIMESD